MSLFELVERSTFQESIQNAPFGTLFTDRSGIVYNSYGPGFNQDGYIRANSCFAPDSSLPDASDTRSHKIYAIDGRHYLRANADNGVTRSECLILQPQVERF